LDCPISQGTFRGYGIHAASSREELHIGASHRSRGCTRITERFSTEYTQLPQ
jgi:hypothetical protein